MSGSAHLEFIPDGHRYLLNGQPVPSVTQVLEPLSSYAHVPPAVLEAAARLGQAVHRATELDDRNDLDESTVHSAVLPYLVAWRRFRRESGFEIEHAEFRVYSETYRYAGTPDRLGILPYLATKSKRALLDIKTTADFMPSFGPQLAGYWQGVRESRLYDNRAAAAIRRFAVQLRDNGTYRLQEYPDRGDWQVFHSCLVIHNFLRR